MKAQWVPRFTTAAMTGRTWLGFVFLIFLASLGYVVLGGADDIVSAPTAQTSFAVAATNTAAASGALRDPGTSAGAATPLDYFPANYANRGRDGEGNVITYEHD